MNKFEKLIELNKEFDGILIEDRTNAVWYKDDDYTCWNTDGNLDELYDGEGNTYSGDSLWLSVEDANYYLTQIDSGCGESYFVLFKKDNQVGCK